MTYKFIVIAETDDPDLLCAELRDSDAVSATDLRAPVNVLLKEVIENYVDGNSDYDNLPVTWKVEEVLDP